MAQTSRPVLSLEESKVVLQKILDAFEIPENRSRLDEARETAGKDMMKIMQLVFPLTVQIQMEIIKEHGFTADGEGAIKFAQLIRHHEKSDSAVSELAAQLKTVFLPTLPNPVSEPVS